MKNVRADNPAQVTSRFRYHTQDSLRVFFIGQPKTAPLVTDSVFCTSVDLSLHAFSLLRDRMYILCCTVSFSSRHRQRTLQFSLNHVGNSCCAPVSLISLIVPDAPFVPGTIIASYIKSPIHTRDKAFLLSDAPASNEMLVVSFRATSHFVNFRQRTRSSSSCF